MYFLEDTIAKSIRLVVSFTSRYSVGSKISIVKQNRGEENCNFCFCFFIALLKLCIQKIAEHGRSMCNVCTLVGLFAGWLSGHTSGQPGKLCVGIAGAEAPT